MGCNGYACGTVGCTGSCPAIGSPAISCGASGCHAIDCRAIGIAGSIPGTAAGTAIGIAGAAIGRRLGNAGPLEPPVASVAIFGCGTPAWLGAEACATCAQPGGAEKDCSTSRACKSGGEDQDRASWCAAPLDKERATQRERRLPRWANRGYQGAEMRCADLFRRELLDQLPDLLGDLISSLLVSALHDCEPPPTLGAAETSGGAAEPPS